MGYNTPVAFGDGPSIDAFSRARVSEPVTRFESSFLYDLQPLLYEQIVTGSGTVTYDADNSQAVLATTDTGSDTAVMQSFQQVRYQPGKSQLIFITFNFHGGQTGVDKFVGYSDGVNGFEFGLVGTLPVLRRLSSSDAGNLEVPRYGWNMSVINGLDLTKTQILVIDLQWLGVGRVRMGFDIDGVLTYAHEFRHANHQEVVYTQRATLPIRAGIASVDTADEMTFICSSVSSEGGTDTEYGYSFGYANGAVTAADGVDTSLLSLRPATTFNSQPNRGQIILESVDIFNGGSNPIIWKIGYGATFSAAPTWAAANATYSSSEITTAPGTLSGLPIAAQQGVIPNGTGAVRVAVSAALRSFYPLTLNAAGAQRALGTLTVTAQGVGGTSTNCRAVLNWLEVR